MNNIITLSGDPGSGKSTTADALEEYFENKAKRVVRYSVGDIFRNLANEKGMTVTEFSEFLEKNNCNVDNSLDKAVRDLGKKISDQSDENTIYLIDSRLAWHNIPESFKIRLVTTDIIAGKRVFEDKSRGEEDRYDNLESAIEETRKRKQLERERYIKTYGLDLQKLEQYDLVVDTSYAEVSDIADVIAKCMEAKNKGEEFSKYWKSPKQFLPIQPVKQTIVGNAHSSLTLKEWKEKIISEGIEINKPIKAIKLGETYFVRDGHHRNFGTALAGKTLVPYEVKWGEKSRYFGVSTDDFIKLTVLGDSKYDRDLYAYENMLSEGEEHFCYNSVYPGIEKGNIYLGYKKDDGTSQGESR